MFVEIFRCEMEGVGFVISSFSVASENVSFVLHFFILRYHFFSFIIFLSFLFSSVHNSYSEYFAYHARFVVA